MGTGWPLALTPPGDFVTSGESVEKAHVCACWHVGVVWVWAPVRKQPQGPCTDQVAGVHRVTTVWAEQRWCVRLILAPGLGRPSEGTATVLLVWSRPLQRSPGSFPRLGSFPRDMGEGVQGLHM